MTEAAATTAGSRRADIQGLRAIAVLLVVAFHAGLPLPGGFIGVDVFFVISGFVITGLLLRELTASGRLSLARFYGRRIKRLLPALTLMVITVLLASWLLPSPLGQPQETIKTAIGTMLLSANIVIERSIGNYFAPTAQDNPLLNTWSLSVEEQFYVLFPVLLAAVWMLRRAVARQAIRMSMVVLAAVAALSFALVLAVPRGLHVPTMGGNPQAFVFLSASTRAWEFLAGSMLALAVARISLRRSTAWGLLSVGLMLIAISAFAINDQAAFPSPVTLVPVTGTLLVLTAGATIGGAGGNPLTTRPMVLVGDWSYSWYLWHWPVIVFAVQVFGRSLPVTLIAAVVSLIPALLSFRLVEQPMRTWTWITPRKSVGLLIVCVAPTLIVAFVTAQAVQFGWGQPWSMGAHVAMQRNCDAQPSDFGTCTWNPDGENGTVFLVGDSQSWALADGVIEAATNLGMATTVVSTNACPFVDPATAGVVAGPGCAESIERTLAQMKKAPPSVLMIATSESYPEPDLARGYAQVIGLLPEPSPQVVVVRPPPGGDEYSGRQSILFKPGADERSLPQKEPSPNVTDWLSSMGSSVLSLDPRDTLCLSGSCSVAVGGDELYSNGNHLSVQGAQLLVPGITRLLREATGASPVSATAQP